MEFGYIVSPRSIRNGFWLATKSEVSISDWLKIIVDQSETVKAQNDLQWFFDKLDRYFNLFFLCDSFCFFDNRKMQIAKRRKRNPLDTLYYSNNLWNFTHIKRTRNRFYFFKVKSHLTVTPSADEKNPKICMAPKLIFPPNC